MLSCTTVDILSNLTDWSDFGAVDCVSRWWKREISSRKIQEWSSITILLENQLRKTWGNVLLQYVTVDMQQVSLDCRDMKRQDAKKQVRSNPEGALHSDVK